MRSGRSHVIGPCWLYDLVQRAPSDTLAVENIRTLAREAWSCGFGGRVVDPDLSDCICSFVVVDLGRPVGVIAL